MGLLWPMQPTLIQVTSMTDADRMAKEMSTFHDVSTIPTAYPRARSNEPLDAAQAIPDDFAPRDRTRQRSRTLPSILNDEEMPMDTPTTKPPGHLQIFDDYDSLAGYRSFRRRHSLPVDPAELSYPSPPSRPAPRNPSPLRKEVLQPDEDRLYTMYRSKAKLEFLRHDFLNKTVQQSQFSSTNSLNSQITQCPESPISELHNAAYDEVDGKANGSLKLDEHPTAPESPLTELNNAGHDEVHDEADSNLEWEEGPIVDEELRKIFKTTLRWLFKSGPRSAKSVESAEEVLQEVFLNIAHFMEEDMDYFMSLGWQSKLKLYDEWQRQEEKLGRGVDVPVIDVPFQSVDPARGKLAYIVQCRGVNPVDRSSEQKIFDLSHSGFELLQYTGHSSKQESFPKKANDQKTKRPTKLQLLRRNKKQVDYFAWDFVEYPSFDSDLLSFLKVPGAELDPPETFKPGQRAKLHNLYLIATLENWIQNEVSMDEPYQDIVAGRPLVLDGSIKMNKRKFQTDLVKRAGRLDQLGAIPIEDDKAKLNHSVEMKDSALNHSFSISDSAGRQLPIRQPRSPSKRPMDRSQSMSDLKGIPPGYGPPLVPKRKPVGSICVSDPDIVELVVLTRSNRSSKISDLDLSSPACTSEVPISVKSDLKVRFQESEIVNCSTSVDDSNCSTKGIRTSSVYSQETAREEDFGVPFDLSENSRSLSKRLGEKVRRARRKIGSLGRGYMRRGEVKEELFTGVEHLKIVN